MLDNYYILEKLGLAMQDGSLIFYDDESLEHILKFQDIKDITIEKPFIALETKLGFWFNKLFVKSQTFGIFDKKLAVEDYRKFYELEIEILNNIVLSRNITGIDFNEVEKFILNLNKIINNQ